MNDGVLRLRIAVDGSDIIPLTMEKASTAVATQTRVINQQFREASIASRQMGSDISWGLGQIAPAAQKAEYSATEAKHAIRGMGEEIGIHMPRFVSTFLADIPQVGAALASAFSVVAVIGIVEIIATQLPEAFHKLEGAITGWDETAKKAYDHFLEENQKADEAVRKFALDLENVGKAPAVAAANAADSMRAHLVVLGEELKASNREIERLENAKKPNLTGQIAPTDTSPSGALEDAQARNLKIQEEMQKASVELLKLTRETEIKVAEEKDKASKETGKKGADDAKRAAEEQLRIERAFRAAQDAVYREHVLAALKEAEDYNRREQAEADAMHQVILQGDRDEVARGEQIREHAAAEALRAEEDQRREGERIYNQAVQDAIHAAEEKYRIEQKAIADFKKLQDEEAKYVHRMVQTLDSNFNDHLLNWIKGQETLKTALEQSWNSIASNAIGNLIRMGEQELIAHLLHKSLAKEGILVDAKAAAASAFHHVMKALPFPADVIVAPVVAAGVFAGVAAFGSFAGGGIVPNDGMHELHKKEMVLTPSLSTGIQQLILNGAGGEKRSGGDIHVHYTAHGSGSREDHKQNAAEIVKIIRKEHRRGALSLS